LLNSTPLGEVITTAQLQRHRTSAGLRLGQGQSVNLLSYVAWLVLERHAPLHSAKPSSPVTIDLTEVAQGAAALGSRSRQLPQGHGQKLTRKQERVIAALLTEPTHAAAAGKAGVGEATLYRWMAIPQFRDAYRQARREIVEGAVGRMQAATGQAVETLVTVARQGRREGDRVKAAIALLDRAYRSLAEGDILHGEADQQEALEVNTSNVVLLLAKRMRQLDHSELPTAEKSRLSATLDDALH
jgi:hypothetical protein